MYINSFLFGTPSRSHLRFLLFNYYNYCWFKFFLTNDVAQYTDLIHYKELKSTLHMRKIRQQFLLV